MARGKLRIYLGAAPGVGKTFAMLNEGWRGHDRGTDVVVGLVETHGRPTHRRAGRATSRSSRATKIEYRGADVRGDGRRRDPRPDATSSRSSTSSRTRTCPGSRNEKRWQDVEELLDAGIDVISTLNIQHLESVNDVVERITGVKQQETIPDAVVRAAEQVELVDMTPEALRRRMAHGNIYPAERVDAVARPTTSGPATSPRCARSRCSGSPTGSRRTSSSTSRTTASRRRGRRASASSSRSPARRAATRSSGARRAWRAARQGDLVGVHVRPTDGLADRSPELLERAPPAARGSRRHVPGDRGERRRRGARERRPGRARDPARARREPPVALDAPAARFGGHRQVLRASGVDRRARDLDRRGRGAVRAATDRARRQAPGDLPASRRCWRSVARRGRCSHCSRSSSTCSATTLEPAERPALLPPRRGRGRGHRRLRPRGRHRGRPRSCSRTGSSRRRSTRSRSPSEDHLVALIVFVIVGAVVGELVESRRPSARAGGRARGPRPRRSRGSRGTLLSEHDPLPALMSGLRTAFACAIASRCCDATATAWRVESGAGDPVPPPPRGRAGERAARRRHHARGLRAADSTRPTSTCCGRSPVSSRSPSTAAGFRAEAAAAEGLAEANELRTALLAAVSHDLRTPLASIKASVTSLLQPDVDARRRTLATSSSRRSTRRPTASTTSSATCST